MNREYPKGSAIRYVSDHHHLLEKQRFVLLKAIVFAYTALRRMAKALRPHALTEQDGVHGRIQHPYHH